MNALNNANTDDNHAGGLLSFAFPPAQSATGESVDYVPSVGRQWYVLRIKYGQVRRAANLLTAAGIYTYLAMVWKDVRRDGRCRRVKVPFMNLLFTYATEEEAEHYVRGAVTSQYITYYYNHFKKDSAGKNPPLTIDEKDIKMLIRATSPDNEHVREVSLQQCCFISNDIVHVTEGPFQGIRGRVARIARQQRVVVYIQGLHSAISTAYIPSYCLEKVGHEI